MPRACKKRKCCANHKRINKGGVAEPQWCPELRHIILPCAKNSTDKGISRALRCWKYIEMMSYGPFDSQILTDRHLPRTIEEIGVNCKNLQYLTLSGFHLHWKSSDVMVRYLKSLK